MGREWDIPGETPQVWHHGSENLIQIFLMDSSNHLKYKFILAKLLFYEFLKFGAQILAAGV
jgi:hypothetical protein